jgi:hypothetical protein
MQKPSTYVKYEYNTKLILFMVTHKYTVWTQRSDLYVKAGGKYSNHCALIGEISV